MHYRIKITPVALSDLQRGINYYQEQQPGLGKRFASIIEKALDKIQLMPLSSSIAYDDIRYKVIDKFPYVILYKVDANAISILRVFNTHMQPDQP